MITKADLAAALVDIRVGAGLRQRDIVRQGGLLRSVVSRLESPSARLPALEMIARYGQACGLEVWLLFGTTGSNNVVVHSAAALEVIGPQGSQDLDDAYGGADRVRHMAIGRKVPIALALAGARKSKGLSQAELAQRAGWTAQFACKVEAVTGRVPDLMTLARYGKACGTDVGLFFSRPAQERFSFLHAITLQRCGECAVFDHLTSWTSPLSPAELAEGLCEITLASPAECFSRQGRG